MAHIEAMGNVSVHVNDFKRAVKFYEKGFGLKAEVVMDEMGWAQFQVPGSTSLGVHLWGDTCKKNGGRPPGTVTGIAFTVDDPHAFAKQVTANGGKITDPVQKQAWGPVGGTAADPDGNEFLFSEPMDE